MDEFEKIRVSKAEDRGAFRKQLLLKGVINNQGDYNELRTHFK